jgi:hypothetical protein
VKKLNKIGKILIAIGMLSFFRRVHGFYGYGGYVDNTQKILITGILIINIGALFILISKKLSKESN